MGSTLIDFKGRLGDHTPFSVYEVERDGEGKFKILRTIFKPHPAQIEFFSARERHVLLHGNRGCGKSAGLLWKAIQMAYLVPGCRAAIFRKTWPELKRSLWDEAMKLPPDLYHDLNASDHTVIIRAKDADGTWKLSKIWFITAQNVEDARKILSFEVHTLLIDEWAEVEPEIWRFMSGSVRSPISTDLAGRPTSAQILGGSTPGGVGAEALRCLFGCDGPKKQAPGEDKNTYTPEKYRAIKASIDQNPTYAVGTPAGDQYRSSLQDLPPALQAKWIGGEWGAFEGAYFSNWNAKTMVIPYATVGANWWDSYFISLDYGFGKSSASAHLHVRTQDGKLKTIWEFVTQHMPATDFAQEVARRFVASLTQGERRNIQAVYLDPSNFKNIGDGHTIADQISEVLEPYGLAAIPASNDRAGGWQLMFSMLKSGEWQVADSCPMLIAAIPSRVHDPKRPGDVLKVSGDPLDDVADDVRYGIYTFITSTEKPLELKMRETMKQFAEVGDLNSAYIRAQQMIADQSATSKPIRLGRYRPPGRY